MIVVHSHTEITAAFLLVDETTGDVVDRKTLSGTLTDNFNPAAWQQVYTALDAARRALAGPCPTVDTTPAPEPAVTPAPEPVEEV